MNTHGGFPRRAVTLIELLVVIAIIGMLVAVLLPSLQSARETARRMHCSNNLRQWSLGMQRYEQTNGVLPIGQSGWTCTVQHWVPLLWPYIEQESLARSYDYLVNYSASGTAFTVLLPLYYCPSDRPNTKWTYGGANMPRFNYVLNRTKVTISSKQFTGPFGYHSDCGPTGFTSFDPRGFTGAAACRLASIRDGLSNTLLMSEYNVWRTESDRETRGMIEYIYFSSVLTPNSAFDMIAWWWIPPNYYTGNEPPYLPAQITANSDFTYAARSRHPGGVQAAYCDGAVQFVNDDVDQATWQAQGTKNARD